MSCYINLNLAKLSAPGSGSSIEQFVKSHVFT
jgi:hypothetical protein